MREAALGAYKNDDNVLNIKQKAMLKINETLEDEGLALSPAPADGDCFYHALNQQLGDDPMQIRTRVHAQAKTVMQGSQQMWDDVPVYDIDGERILKDVLDEDVQNKYIAQLPKGKGPNHWASVFHGPLVARAYQRPVIIYSYNRASDKLEKRSMAASNTTQNRSF